MHTKTYSVPENLSEQLRTDSIRYRNLTALGDSSTLWQSRWLRELISLGTIILDHCEELGITPQELLERKAKR